MARIKFKIKFTHTAYTWGYSEEGVRYQHSKCNKDEKFPYADLKIESIESVYDGSSPPNEKESPGDWKKCDPLVEVHSYTKGTDGIFRCKKCGNLLEEGGVVDSSSNCLGEKEPHEPAIEECGRHEFHFNAQTFLYECLNCDKTISPEEAHSGSDWGFD